MARRVNVGLGSLRLAVPVGRLRSWKYASTPLNWPYRDVEGRMVPHDSEWQPSFALVSH